MKIDFIPVAVKRVDPDANALDLDDGRRIEYDYLIIATGPRLALDEVPGLGPHGGFTHSVCHVDHAVTAEQHWQDFVADPGPVSYTHLDVYKRQASTPVNAGSNIEYL